LKGGSNGSNERGPNRARNLLKREENEAFLSTEGRRFGGAREKKKKDFPGVETHTLTRGKKARGSSRKKKFPRGKQKGTCAREIEGGGGVSLYTTIHYLKKTINSLYLKGEKGGGGEGTASSTTV